MKSKSLLIGAALIASLSLTACSAAETKPTTAAPAATEQKVDIKSGAEKMRHELADLKGALEAGNAAKAKEYANEAHEAWEVFEDAVKAKDKAVYEKIEEPLSAITAGVKAATLDKKILGEQVAKLDALLADLVK
ncbi:MAG TPA: hypothetical protein VNT01_08345 [Symbiobacteriaceae bacterium]|nr:hypothetical protein [Symbiobacteriaceae bacterium]